MERERIINDTNKNQNYNICESKRQAVKNIYF